MSLYKEKLDRRSATEPIGLSPKAPKSKAVSEPSLSIFRANHLLRQQHRHQKPHSSGRRAHNAQGFQRPRASQAFQLLSIQDGRRGPLRPLVQNDQVGQHFDPMDLQPLPFWTPLEYLRVPVLQATHLPALHSKRLRCSVCRHPD